MVEVVVGAPLVELVADSPFCAGVEVVIGTKIELVTIVTIVVTRPNETIVMAGLDKFLALFFK